ncbi:MAG: GNAT family N-acetyltransferase [Anaerolineales bacterium]|nr:GNAT family N-acetyltransferase [Anaerolineales bacterium]
MPLTLLPASQFTIEELTDAYNQTRVDYLVPMPLNAARLREYIQNYDVDMPRSVVALDGNEIRGINMLGVRAGRTWITRLGVLPAKRRQGTGEAMMHYLLEAADQLGYPFMILEVIKDNVPAHTLFKKLAFNETRELLILRRAPDGQYESPQGQTNWLAGKDALVLLESYPEPLAWTNQVETYRNAGDAQALQVELMDGSCGWLVFRQQRFYLSHFVFHTTAGDPVRVANALLAQVHNRFTQLDTHTENIAADDPHLPAFWNFSYFEAFRRIEMVRQA